jgi:hypothetical protein
MPHLSAIQRAFGRHDVSGIQAHVGGPATEATQAIGAEAYASGNHIAFGGVPDLHTAAHEAAHVVQQSGGVQLKGGVGAAGDPYEHHADQVADAVVSGKSAEALLDTHAGGSSRGDYAVQRKPAASSSGGGDRQAETGPEPLDGGGQLGYMLAQPAPALGDPAVTYLLSLPMPRLLDELDDAVACGYALKLEARVAFAPPILSAALQAVELARTKPMTPNHPVLQRAGAALDVVSRDQQVQILSWILHRNGVSIEATTLVEGVIAMKKGSSAGNDSQREQTGNQNTVSAGAGSRSTAGVQVPMPIEPGEWRQPGQQPKWLYIGNAVHDAIGKHYQEEHLGQDVAANYFPISSLLGRFEKLAATGGAAVSASALRPDELSRRPDIVNIDLQHLYEIKPKAARAQGAAKARMYMAIFAKAGVMVQLGPVGDPGTVGVLPAPNGVVIFESPEPGVITYDYQNARLVPVPVQEPKTSPNRGWQWQIQPLTREQQAAVATTTIGGGMLILLMMALSPLGA